MFRGLGFDEYYSENQLIETAKNDSAPFQNRIEAAKILYRNSYDKLTLHLFAGEVRSTHEKIKLWDFNENNKYDEIVSSYLGSIDFLSTALQGNSSLKTLLKKKYSELGSIDNFFKGIIDENELDESEKDSKIKLANFAAGFRVHMPKIKELLNERCPYSNNQNATAPLLKKFNEYHEIMENVLVEYITIQLDKGQNIKPIR